MSAAEGLELGVPTATGPPAVAGSGAREPWASAGMSIARV